MATLVTTITETLRYRGKIGQWSWVFHRLSGLGIVLFVYLHVIDTSWAAFYPELYAEAIHFYQSPLFTLGEFGLVAAVVYHAINGYRIIYLDWRPQFWHLQHRAAVIVFAIVAVILIPVFILMAGHVVDFYNENDVESVGDIISGTDQVASLSEAILGQAQFAIGLLVTVGVALVLSFTLAAVRNENANTDSGIKRPSQLDIWFWKFMRYSGLLILPLVFGHLAMMHVLQGVFELTGHSADIIGTDAVNSSGSVLTFVGERWDYLVAGVAVWRIYDGLLLALIVVHGFYGLHLVVDDYAHNRVVNRALNWTIIFGAAFLIIVGFAALIAGVEGAARDIVVQAAQR
ncbi:MAG TPA: succinate dehydrogenase, cytochrome b556 subunit [Aggregatilineales bacterium]|nr:succinate dehydrogenase, cytochrome b556 subunit [Aggregatilineales bacterium]